MSAKSIFVLNEKPSKPFQIPGYDPKLKQSSYNELSNVSGREAALKRQLMQVAYSPGKQLFMTGFMLWMSGSTLNIFSIMMTGMALLSPVKSLFSLSTVFGKFSEVNNEAMLKAKVIFLALNCVGLAMGLYKLGNMGLLPLYSSDWISLIDEELLS